MADTEDLKSSGPKARAGSSPALGITAIFGNTGEASDQSTPTDL